MKILKSEIKWFVIIAFFFIGCKSNDHSKPLKNHEVIQTKVIPEVQKETQTDLLNWKFRYDLNRLEKCVLPQSLVEISALTADDNSDIIYTINDELAIIYGVQNCELISEHDFGKNGDYEGIEKVNDNIYVLKSSGKIIEYDINLELTKREIKTPLNSKNDVEGLGYDKQNNTLLIACKGSPNILQDQKLKKTKAIYSYDLNNDVFIDKPLFVIDDDELESFLYKQDQNLHSKKEMKKRIKRALKFSPSAIAKNPNDSCYYMLSSVGNILLVVSADHEIIAIEFLDHPSFIQPEGICFNSIGEMVISNEGKGLVANILKFSLI